MFLGPSLRLGPHSTSVHCLVVGVDGPVAVRPQGAGEISARSVLVAPRVVHQVVVPDSARVLFCFADVSAVGARDLSARMRRHDQAFATDHRDEATLVSLAAATEPDGREVMEVAFGRRESSPDPRIARTTARLLRDPAEAAAARDLARLEGLSTSYFLRLFASQTGTSFRRYRLWARMLQVAREVAAGADLTTASIAAGFATPSHFSDAFSRMFGLSATALASSGAQLLIAEER
jgi:AraC-like DNA-binding protein